jgi:uncharacterized protein (TIGR02588 family)
VSAGAGGRASYAIPRAEWAVAGLSALLILGAVGFLAVRATRPAAPPDLVALVDTVTGRDGRWTVRVRVENRGDRTAAAVEVEGTLGAAGERSGFTLDFVAGRSARHGALLFAGDPRTRPPALRVRGYADP